MQFIGHFLLAAVLFVAIDAVWIGVVANMFYKRQLGKLLRPRPNLVAAAVFYAIYIAALVTFVINPALGARSFGYALSQGALLGLAMYATYDLTNLSTLINWPKLLTLVDLVWGTAITTAVSCLSYVILR